MQAQRKHFPFIDALRGIAVCLVVLFHVFPESVSFGFLGVDIFFGVSGFLITQILIQDDFLNFRGLKEFFWRRVRRIFPALFAFSLISFFLSLFLLTPDELRLFGKELYHGSLFITNLVQKNGYFDTDSALNPFLHLWSLSIEVQFYVLFPLTLMLGEKFGLSRRLIIWILFFLSFVFAAFCFFQNSLTAFYNPLCRIWEFMVGSLAFLFLRGPITSNFLSPFKRLAQIKPLIWFGLISFSLFLWHWFILYVFRLEFGFPLSLNLRWWVIVISIVASCSSFYFIEQPLKKQPPSKRGIAIFVSGWLVSISIGWLSWKQNGLPFRMHFLETTMTEQVQKQLQGTDWEFSKNNLCLEKFYFPNAKKRNWWFCMLNKDASPTILILGSSYANHLYPGIASHSRLKQHTILSIGTCDPAGEYAKNPVHPCFGKNHDEEMVFLNSIVRNSTSVKFIILSGLRPPEELKEPYIELLKQRLSFFSNKGVKTIVVLPHVKSNYNLRDCYNRPWRKRKRDCLVDKIQVDAIRRVYYPMAKNIKSEIKDVLFFDPNGTFCNGADCSFLKHGLPMFRDFTSHLSVFGSERVSEHLVNWAMQEVPSLLE